MYGNFFFKLHQCLSDESKGLRQKINYYWPIAVIINDEKGVTVHGACLLLGIARGIKTINL